MERIKPRYEEDLTNLAAELVTPARYGRAVLANVVDLHPQAEVLPLFPHDDDGRGTE